MRKAISIPIHDAYNNVIDIAKWVISEMKELNIKRIQKVYDYLEEQIQKQYECDIANGGKELKNLDVLALKRPKKERKLLPDLMWKRLRSLTGTAEDDNCFENEVFLWCFHLMKALTIL